MDAFVIPAASYLVEDLRFVTCNFRLSSLASWSCRKDGENYGGFPHNTLDFIVLSQLKEQRATMNQPENIDVVKTILKRYVPCTKIYSTRNKPTTSCMCINISENIWLIFRQTNEPSSFVEVKSLSQEAAAKYLENGIVPLSNEFDISTILDQYATTASKMSFFQQVHKSNHPVIRVPIHIF